MQFKLLGPLEATDGQRLIDLGPPKQRALLALLLIDVNRVISLDRLIDELWSGEPPPRATASLQAYVSNLRRVLEPDRRCRMPARVLVTRAPGYLLRIDAEDIDSARFEVLAAAGRRHLAGGRAKEARLALDDALALWRGPALADVAREPFTQTERARLDELRLVALETRLEADLALGAHAEAVPELQALVAAEPLRERAWALLMLALYRSGRQAEALRALQVARTTLAEELGLDPGPALSRLEGQILAHSPSLDWDLPAAGADTDATPGPVGAPEPSSFQPASAGGPGLIGRQQPLATLEAALGRTMSGCGRLILLSGEAGIGKTRLAEEVARSAVQRGFEVVWGRCWEGRGEPALWPWIQVVRDLVARGEAETLRTALGPGATAIAQVVVEVRDLMGSADPTASLESDAARFRVYDALVRFLTRLAAQRALVIVLEDLHWADVFSLEVARLLVESVGTARVLVVGTYRDAEIPPEQPLAEALSALVDRPSAQALPLRGLSHGEVAQLIADITGTAPSGRLVSEVHARTEGNPLFVRELVRLLASEGHLTGEGELADQMPARVRDVIRRRISRLPEATTALLVVAAVIGRDFSLPVLEEVSGLEGDRALALVEAALMSGIVVDSPEIVGGFRFSHVLVRQALCDQLSAVRRARLHARVARALESIYGTDDDAHVVELAHHLFQAAPVLGPERGFEYALRAAEMARSGFAYEQAVEQLGHALELLRATPSGLERVRRELDVQIRLGTVSTMAEGYAAARVARAWARARDLSQQAGDGRGYLRSLWGQQASVFVRADFGLVRQIAHQLLASAGGSAEREYLLAGHAAFGMADFHQGKLKAADEHLERAQALSDALAGRSLMDVFVFDPAVVTRAYRAMSWSLLGEQDGRSRELCSEALWVADRRGQPFTRVLARLLAACVARLLGDVPEVRRRLDQAMALADRWRFASYTAIGSICRGWILAHQDTATAGVAEMEAGLRALDRAGWRIMWPFFLSMLAEARWQAKQVDEALAAVERGLEEAETLGEHFYDAELWRLRGDLLLARWPEYGAEAARSLRRAVVVAEHQSAALHRRRAEASLTRLRSSEPPTGARTGPDRIVAGTGPVA